jgi:non-ribosomal peptide synthetase component E (peptide arylation enzyme)
MRASRVARRHGDRVCAVVALRVTEASLTLGNVQQYLEDRGVAKFTWLERLEFVDALPRTEIGKVHKVRLREALESA